MSFMEEEIFQDIKERIKEVFKLEIIDYNILNKGLLNLKWKVMTNKGFFFIKQYNENRYPISNEKHSNRLKNAVSTQRELSEGGIRCPKILTFNGECILTTNKNIRFIITEYIDGRLVEAGKINSDQFYDLGFEIAKIHKLVNSMVKNEDIESSWVIPSKEELINKCNKSIELTNDQNSEEINRILKLQKEIFVNIDMSIFKDLKSSYAHSDLWCDNVLFYPNSLSAIIDFDRFQYIYEELDISRAMLSFALDNNNLDIELIKSFIKGYNQVGNITLNDVSISLKLLYFLESFWWLNESSIKAEGPPKRFAEEMIWLTNNWTNLDEILNS